MDAVEVGADETLVGSANAASAGRWKPENALFVPDQSGLWGGLQDGYFWLRVEWAMEQTVQCIKLSQDS